MSNREIQTDMIGQRVVPSELALDRMERSKINVETDPLWRGAPSMDGNYLATIRVMHLDPEGSVLYTLVDPFGTIFEAYAHTFKVAQS